MSMWRYSKVVVDSVFRIFGVCRVMVYNSFEKMKRKSKSSTGIPPVPSGFDEEQELAWKNLAPWRLIFLKKRSRIKRTLLLDWVKINLPTVLIAILLGRLLYLNTSISIDNASLSTLAIGILSASAAILTIIVAFLTFWFSSANNNMQRTKDMIRSELSNLETTERDIEQFTGNPKEDLPEPRKAALIKLAEKSETFLNALKTLGGRFYRATLGTYYDSLDSIKLDIAIGETGGEWFVAYLSVFNKHSDRDYCGRVWNNAVAISRRFNDLNAEVRRATNQVTQIVYFMPTLISVLVVFIFSLFIAFIFNTTSGDYFLPVTKLVFGSILVILTATHLVNIVRFLWVLVSSRYVANETNRLFDIQTTANLEKQRPIDYTKALKKYAETIVKADAKRTA